MGLIDTINRLLGRQTAEPTTSDELPRPAPSPTEVADSLRSGKDRESQIRLCREMYASDPRAEGVIRTLARDMIRGGYTVQAEGPRGAEAVAIADALDKRLGLMQRLDDWTRLTLRDGDTFLELSVNRSNEIVGATRKPTLEVRRNSNEADQFTDPRRAFWQSGGLWIGIEPPSDAIWYAQWQMIHARWGHDEGSRYGKPLFSSSTSAWKRVREGETDMAVRRKTRAGIKYHHKFPQGTSPAEIDAYVERNRDVLDNPTAAIADYFGTTDISILSGDADVSRFEDVMHHVRTWWLASPVPMAALGYGQDLNRDVLDPQMEQYERALQSLTGWVEAQLVVPLLERQWLLAGLLPETLDYEIKWHSTEVVQAAVVRDISDAAVRLLAIGIPQERVQEIVGMFLPGVELGEGEGAEEQGSRGAEENRASAGRMAEIADRLRA